MYFININASIAGTTRGQEDAANKGIWLGSEHSVYDYLESCCSCIVIVIALGIDIVIGIAIAIGFVIVLV